MLALTVFAAARNEQGAGTAIGNKKTPQVGIEYHPPGTKGGPMMFVPAGEFNMGSEHGQDIEQPVHRIYLDDFYIDKFEVTNEQFNKCVKSKGCTAVDWPEPLKFNPRQPIVLMYWYQADRYCKWAGKRLPTEAEWEKAARGTDGRTYPWGNEIDCSMANYNECRNPETIPVGSYPKGASPYGAMDMAGNAQEWVADWYDEDYYKNSPYKNPTGPSNGSLKVIRGGGVSGSGWNLTSYRRWRGTLTGVQVDYGFRCAR